MDKIAIVLLVILLIIAGLGLLIYFGQIRMPEADFGQSSNDAQKTVTPTSSPSPDIEGVLPAIQPNALEDKPDINPIDAANPVQNIKTNPFE